MLGFSFIFYLLSNYLPVWGTDSSKTITFGLWKVCLDGSVSSSTRTECANIRCSTKDSASDACVKLLYARIMITAACIFTPIAAILLVLFIQKQELFNRSTSITMKALIVGSLLAGILGLSLGINGITGNAKGAVKIGYAAIFAIVAVLLNFLGTIAGLFMRKDEAQ